MSAPKEENSGITSRAAERLTVLWIVCTVLVVLMIVMVTLLGREKLRVQSDVIAQQTHEIETLGSRVDGLEDSIQSLRRQAARNVAPAQPPASIQTPPPEVSRGNAPAANAPAETDVLNRLAQLLVPRPGSQTPTITDTPAAIAVVEQVDAAGQSALSNWAGETWAQLALLAHLAGAPESAAVYADRARKSGAAPVAYDGLRVRELLHADKPADAVTLAVEWAGADTSPPEAPILLAAARIAAGQVVAARTGLKTLPRLDRISSDDRLLLADVLVQLDRWDDLRTVLADWRAPTPAAQRTINRYRALEAIQRGQYAAGLAILDELLQSDPNDYELRLWRAICLAKAGQRDAAREALTHEALDVDRPEVWYWRGMVELASGNTKQAAEDYQRAVANDRGYAPAWEALGSLALNRPTASDVAEAIRLLNIAVQAGPDRPSAYFLLAVAQARASDRAATVAALKRALALNPKMLDTALATETIVTFLGEPELRRIAASAPNETE